MTLVKPLFKHFTCLQNRITMSGILDITYMHNMEIHVDFDCAFHLESNWILMGDNVWPQSSPLLNYSNHLLAYPTMIWGINCSFPLLTLFCTVVVHHHVLYAHWKLINLVLCKEVGMPWPHPCCWHNSRAVHPAHYVKVPLTSYSDMTLDAVGNPVLGSTNSVTRHFFSRCCCAGEI